MVGQSANTVTGFGGIGSDTASAQVADNMGGNSHYQLAKIIKKCPEKGFGASVYGTTKGF